MAELEKLIVKVEADTSSLDKNIDKAKEKLKDLGNQSNTKDLKLFDVSSSVSSIKKQIENINGMINDAFMFSGNYNKSAGNELKDYFTEQLNDAYKAASAAMEKGDESLFKLMDNFGRDSKITVDYGDIKDELGLYLTGLKKALNEFDNASDPSMAISSLKRLQGNLQSMTGTLPTFDLNTLAASIVDYGSKVEKLKEQLKQPLSLEEQEKVISKINDHNRAVRDLIKSYAKLHNISTKDVANLLNTQADLGGIKVGAPRESKSAKKEEVKFNFGQIVKGLIGVRSIYTLVRKVVTQNEKITQAITNITSAISNLVAPLLNSLSKIFEFYASIIQYFAKTESNSAKTAKNTAKFDEINNISVNDQQADVKSISESWGNLTDLEKALGIAGIAATVAWIVNNIVKLVNFIKESKLTTTIIDGCKKVWAWIAGAITKISTWIAGHLQLLGGIAVAIAGIIIAIKGVIDYLKDSTWSNFGDTLLGIATILAGIALAIGAWPVAVAAAIVAVVALVSKYWEQIDKFFSNISRKLHDLMNNSGLLLKIFFGVISEIWDSIWSLLKSIVTSVRQIFDGIIMIFKGDFKNGLISIGKGILNALIGIVNTVIHGINAIISPIRALIVGAGKILGKSWTMDNIRIPTIPLLAEGGIVNKATLAMIGESGPEAVVPLNKLAALADNTETNSLLKELINRVNNLEMNPYVTVKDVGAAAVNYINKQSRIMGVSVVGG